MAFRSVRVDCMIILLVLFAGHVLTTSKNAAIPKSSKRKNQNQNEPIQLSTNIAENPFLKTQTPTASSDSTYVTNPFLTFPISNSSVVNIQWFDNGSRPQVTHTGPNPFLVSEDNRVHLGIYVNNPFLQPTGFNSNRNDVSNVSNTPVNQQRPTIEINTPKPVYQPVQQPVQQPAQPVTNINNNVDKTQTTNTPPPSSTNLPVKISARTKSDVKCEEYNREILGKVQTTSLVGTGSGVVEVDNDKCGRTIPLVTGGVDAMPGEFPHMAALGRRSTSGSFIFSCGGSLISKTWILSAAHCTYGPDGAPTVVRIGLHTLQDENLGITSNIGRMLRHPSYVPPAMYADIALVELETAVTFNRLIRPACLYQQYDNVPTQAWVSGWGVTEFGGEESNKLQKALLNIIDNVACTIRHNRSIAVPHGVSPSMICAGDPHGGWLKDTCLGDSGGPLQVVHPRSSCLFQIIGVTSFGEGCAVIDSPGVYIRISHYLNWIEDIVWPDR